MKRALLYGLPCIAIIGLGWVFFTTVVSVSLLPGGRVVYTPYYGILHSKGYAPREKIPEGFTFDAQYADDANSTVHDERTVTYPEFLEKFHEFPWAAEVEKMNAGAPTSPTLSVHNKALGIDLWVSMGGTKGNYGYFIGFNMHRIGRTWYGLGAPTVFQHVDMFLVEKKEDVEALYKSYFDGDYISMMEMLKQYPLFLKTNNFD